MKRKFISLVWLIPFSVTLIASTPGLIWRSRKRETLEITLNGPESTGEDRSEQISWLPLHRKSRIEENPDPEKTGGAYILTSSCSSDNSDEEALSAIDRLKGHAMGKDLFIGDGYALTERTHGLFRDRLEDFLGIEKTEWVLKYQRDDDRARLIFTRESGEKMTLLSGEHFRGRPPLVHYNGRSAPVYTWIPVYKAQENTRVTAEVDLSLTEQGKNLLEGAGIPGVIPCILENDNALINTGFFTVNFSGNLKNPGNHRITGKLAYKSWISLFPVGSDDALYWRIYLPWLDDKLRPPPHTEEVTYREEPVSFQARDRDFHIRDSDGGERPFFIKGVNLGPALPGTWFTQFPENEHLYYRWFGEMKALNLNTVRIYTLFPPSFYRALREYNSRHRDDPLYLIQEIWPEEHPEGNNYLGEDYRREYDREIVLTIDALHGNGEVAPRRGRAWGSYRADVSPWILAFLIGREMEPEEILETNRLNVDYVYRGTYVSAPEGPAVEAWLAACCDLAIAYEREHYRSSRPVGIVSWPILDALHHETEWSDPELAGKAPGNDKAVVDIRRMECPDDSFGGLFGAYHIYPNYPDFMNNQSSYATYVDDRGTFRYGGYLREFMGIHGGFPAIVAEYGLSTSAATAHLNPDGYHHGGLNETEQAAGIIRMTDAIRREGYAGAVLFEWIDEWAKKTWTTEPFMIPYDRQALWHNVLDPEQNYGIMAMRGGSERSRIRYESDRTGVALDIWGSESHLCHYLPAKESWERGEKILLGFDTYDGRAGIFHFPGLPPIKTPTGMECLAEIDLATGTARILTAEDYNLTSLSFKSTSRPGQSFRPVSILVNRAYRSEEGTSVPPAYADWSLLRSGPPDEAAFSFHRDEEGLTLRIPWGLLNVSDPSGGTVIDDGGDYHTYPGRDVFETTVSKGIRIYGVLVGKEGSEVTTIPENLNDESRALLYRWEKWDVPAFYQEEKKSVSPLAEYFGGF